VDWNGGFWERRYSAEPVLDDVALVGRLRYVLAHGVKEGSRRVSCRVASLKFSDTLAAADRLAGARGVQAHKLTSVR
jgi:hypothetical protein